MISCGKSSYLFQILLYTFIVSGFLSFFNNLLFRIYLDKFYLSRF